MIVFLVNLCFVFDFIHGQHRNYNIFMPDLPSINSTLSLSSLRITREIHSLTTRSFTKLNLTGGPFNVKLYHNIHSNDNSTSVHVETELSIHRLVLINIEQNDVLTIRMMENLNRTNVTLLIIYRELNELNIDGISNIECVNQIQTNLFRLYNRGTGSLTLNFNVNILDAYLHAIGRMKLCGQVNDEGTIKSLGVGDVDCRNLLTKKMNLISSGIGNIYIMAIDEINIVLSGIGTVYYSGPLKQQIKTGLGNIMEISSGLSSMDQPIIDEDLD